ncbi:hypothetical protein PMAYCL1PPCAC_25632, partial [Pristionchus mayeri]
LDDLLDLGHTEVLDLIILHVQRDLRSVIHFGFIQGPDGERSSDCRLSLLTVVIVVFRRDDDAVSNEESRVESAPPPCQGGRAAIRAGLEVLHESLRSSMRDGSQFDQIGLGHSNSSVEDDQSFLCLVCNDVDAELGAPH